MITRGLDYPGVHSVLWDELDQLSEMSKTIGDNKISVHYRYHEIFPGQKSKGA